MISIKIIRKYLASRQNYIFQLRNNAGKINPKTDYERGYNAGVAHCCHIINKLLNEDIRNCNFEEISRMEVMDNFKEIKSKYNN